MKKFIFISLGFLLSIGTVAQNLDTYTSLEYKYKNTIRLSPVELGRAEFQFAYERYFDNRRTSLATFISLISGNSGSESKEGIQLFFQYRFYLSQLHKSTHKTLNMYNIGFYTAPYILGLIHDENYESGIYDPVDGSYNTVLVNEKTNAVEGGALMGVQFDITQRIVLDFFVGGGIRESSAKKDAPSEINSDYGLLDIGYSGVKPRIGLQMGITF